MVRNKFFNMLGLTVLLLGIITVSCVNEGDICTLNGTAQQGTCTHIKNCQAAIQAAMEGIIPQVCSMIGTVPVVCCLSPQLPELQTTTELATTEAGSLTSYIEEKSRNKCLEYRTSSCSKEKSSGLNALPNEFPHLVHLGFGYQPNIAWKCSGTLISDRWIITTWHCQGIVEGSPNYARIGGSDAASIRAPGNIFRIVKSVNHPDSNSVTFYNDLQLLELDRAVTFSYQAIPACLHTDNEEVLPPPGRLLTGARYSSETINTAFFNILKMTYEVPLYVGCPVKSVSSQRYYPQYKDNKTQICAFPSLGERWKCHEISGSPLTMSNLDDGQCTHTLVGIQSLGNSCKFPNFAYAYTKIAPYVGWIESVVWP